MAASALQKQYSTLQASGNLRKRKSSVDEQEQTVLKYNGDIFHVSLETLSKIEELIRVESESLGKKVKEDSHIVNSDDSDDSSDEWSDPDPDPEEYSDDYDGSDEAMEKLGEEMMERLYSDKEFLKAVENLKDIIKKRENNGSEKKKE